MNSRSKMAMERVWVVVVIFILVFLCAVGIRKWLVLGIREIELFHILLRVMNSRSKMAMVAI